MRIVKLSPVAGVSSPEGALRDPNGLLAIGGDLTAPRLLAAYERGIFPGTRRGSDSVVVARSACGAVPGRVSSQPQPETLLRHDPFRITLNHDFAAVIAACAHRPDEGTGSARRYSAPISICTASAMRTRWRCGRMINWSAACTAWRRARCSAANRCSAALPTPQNAH